MIISGGLSSTAHPIKADVSQKIDPSIELQKCSAAFYESVPRSFLLALPSMFSSPHSFKMNEQVGEVGPPGAEALLASFHHTEKIYFHIFEDACSGHGRTVRGRGNLLTDTRARFLPT